MTKSLLRTYRDKMILPCCVVLINVCRENAIPTLNVNIEDSRHGNYKCLLLKHRTVDTLVMVFNCGVKVT